jgi:hypothetical protein
MPYLLDLVVHGVEMSVDVDDPTAELFLEFTFDGLDQPLILPARLPASYMKWDFPARLILNTSDYSRAFIYSTLATLPPDGGRVNVGRARFPLKAIPIATPKRFKFPLMSAKNSALVAANVHVTAALSTVTNFHSNPPRGPSYQEEKAPPRRYWSGPP